MKEWISLIFQFWGVPPFLYGWSYQVYYEIWILIIYPRSESIEGSLHRLYILTHIFPRHLACWGPGYINLPQKGWWHRHHSTDDILPKFTYTFYCNPRGGWSPSKPMEFLNIASRKSQNLLMLMQGSVYLFWVALLKPAGLEKCWRKTGLFLDYLFIYSESCSKKISKRTLMCHLSALRSTSPSLPQLSRLYLPMTSLCGVLSTNLLIRLVTNPFH